MSTLEQLTEAHDSQAAKMVSKTLDNINWQINPNDVWWMFHEPQVDKLLGRSKRVYWRLLNLNQNSRLPQG